MQQVSSGWGGGYKGQRGSGAQGCGWTVFPHNDAQRLDLRGCGSAMPSHTFLGTQCSSMNLHPWLSQGPMASLNSHTLRETLGGEQGSA